MVLPQLEELEVVRPGGVDREGEGRHVVRAEALQADHVRVRARPRRTERLVGEVVAELRQAVRAVRGSAAHEGGDRRGAELQRGHADVLPADLVP